MNSNTIGVFLPSIHKTGRHDYIAEFCHAAHERGYKVICFSSYTDLFRGDSFDIGERSVYDMALHYEFAAMVIYAELIKNDEVHKNLVEHAKALDIPVFTVDKKLDDTIFINYDYAKAFENIVDHVIEVHGATDIRMISGLKDNPFSNERNEAFRRSLEKHGISFDESLIDYGDFWDYPAQQALKRLLEASDKLPQAIVCANDAMAMGICNELEDMGIKVPDDMIVTGLDGTERARTFFPTITTADCDYKTSAQFVLDVIDEWHRGAHTAPSQHCFGMNMALGQSCGCKVATAASAGMINSNLQSRFERLQYHKLNMDHMVLLANDDRDLEQALVSSKKYINNILYSGMEIYIDPSYFGSPHGLSCKKVLALSIAPHQKDYRVPFTEADPKVLCSDELIDDTGHVMVVPIHCQDKVYGYVVTQYDFSDTEGGERFYDFITNLNIMLSSKETMAKLAEMIKTLDIMYIHDPLTNLLNRRGFYRKLDKLLAEADEKHSRITLLSVDLDGLKYINDNFGHNEGDFAITAVSSVLTDLSEYCGISARFGGDEYMTAMITDKPPEQITKLFRARIEEFSSNAGKPYPINASIGIEIADTAEMRSDIEGVIKRADAKMFEMKRNGAFYRDKLK